MLNLSNKHEYTADDEEVTIIVRLNLFCIVVNDRVFKTNDLKH